MNGERSDPDWTSRAFVRRRQQLLEALEIAARNEGNRRPRTREE
jgi:hypothetical protein